MIAFTHRSVRSMNELPCAVPVLAPAPTPAPQPAQTKTKTTKKNCAKNHNISGHFGSSSLPTLTSNEIVQRTATSTIHFGSVLTLTLTPALALALANCPLIVSVRFYYFGSRTRLHSVYMLYALFILHVPK